MPGPPPVLPCGPGKHRRQPGAVPEVHPDPGEDVPAEALLLGGGRKATQDVLQAVPLGGVCNLRNRRAADAVGGRPAATWKTLDGRPDSRGLLYRPTRDAEGSPAGRPARKQFRAEPPVAGVLLGGPDGCECGGRSTGKTNTSRQRGQKTRCPTGQRL